MWIKESQLQLTEQVFRQSINSFSFSFKNLSYVVLFYHIKSKWSTLKFAFVTCQNVKELVSFIARRVAGKTFYPGPFWSLAVCSHLVCSYNKWEIHLSGNNNCVQISSRSFIALSIVSAVSAFGCATFPVDLPAHSALQAQHFNCRLIYKMIVNSTCLSPFSMF